MRHAIFAPSSGQAPPSGRAVRRSVSRPSGRRCAWLVAARRRCCTSCYRRRIETEAVITVVMRMRRPPDGSCTDLEITGWPCIIRRTISSWRWTARGLATRSGSGRDGRDGDLAGHRRCRPRPAPRPGGWTRPATEPALYGSPSAADGGRPCSPPTLEPVVIPLGERRSWWRPNDRRREPPAHGEQRHAAARGPVRAQLTGSRVSPGGSGRAPGTGTWRRQANRTRLGRHAGVLAAADAATRRDPGRGRDRGDRTGDAGPGNGSDSPSPRSERGFNVRHGRWVGCLPRCEALVSAFVTTSRVPDFS